MSPPSGIKEKRVSSLLRLSPSQSGREIRNVMIVSLNLFRVLHI